MMKAFVVVDVDDDVAEAIAMDLYHRGVSPRLITVAGNQYHSYQYQIHLVRG